MRCVACGLIAIDFAASALAHDAQGVKAPVLVEVADIERRDLRAAKSGLQANGEKSAVAQAGDGVRRRRVEKLAGLGLREGERRAFLAVDGGRCTSTTGLRVAAPCRTRCLNKLERAARRRRTVEGAACSCSRMMRSHAITAR